MKKLRLVLVAVLVAAIFVPAVSYAQAGSVFDHLKCYKIKDSQTKALYKADLVPLQQPPFQVEPGCVIAVPAKMFCIPVDKTNVNPAPPQSVNGGDSQDYLLYKIKCPKQPNTPVIKGGLPVPVTDQFGARTIFVGKHQVLLVPAFKQDRLCRNQSPTATPVCGGDCTNPNEKCVVNSAGTDCGCESPCGLEADGQCGGTCQFPNQVCHNVTLTNGVVDCRCDPFVQGCSLDAAGVCGGDCANPSERCVADTTAGSCSCVPEDVGCKQTGSDPTTCGGLCPGVNDKCTTTGPATLGGFFCYCAEGQACVDSFTTSPQCGGDCPSGMGCRLLNFGNGPIGCGCFFQ